MAMELQGGPAQVGDHDGDARRISASEAGAKIVRIGDTIKHQQKRIARQCVEHLYQPRLVVGNGSARPREVMTGAGMVEVTAPRIDDRRPPWKQITRPWH